VIQVCVLTTTNIAQCNSIVENNSAITLIMSDEGERSRQVTRAFGIVPSAASQVIGCSRLCSLLRAIEHETGVSWLPALLWVLSVVSAFVGPTVKLHVSPEHAWIVNYQLWVLLEGGSGTGKSLLYNKLMRAILDTEQLIQEDINVSAPQYLKHNQWWSILDSTVRGCNVLHVVSCNPTNIPCSKHCVVAMLLKACVLADHVCACVSQKTFPALYDHMAGRFDRSVLVFKDEAKQLYVQWQRLAILPVRFTLMNFRRAQSRGECQQLQQGYVQQHVWI
jgi:hypothetical protein